MKLRTLSLFSGIGGIELGLERSGGFETVAFCEMDKHCQTVLKSHWPEVPIYNDVKTISKDTLPSDINVITGGFPCQDISIGGKRRGIKDGTRSGLWKEFARLINEIRPEYAIIENVGAIRKNGLGIVLSDLARIGYDAEWHIIRASSVGYPQTRERMFIISYPSGKRFNEHIGQERQLQIDSERKSETVHSEGEQRQLESVPIRTLLSRGTFESILSSYPDERAAISGIRRVTDGVPTGMDERIRQQRIKQVGNAVVPRIAEIIGKAIMEAEHGTNDTSID